jgi:hypothetical protein
MSRRESAIAISLDQSLSEGPRDRFGVERIVKENPQRNYGSGIAARSAPKPFPMVFGTAQH